MSRNPGLAVWPATSTHHYLRSFYDALGRCGSHVRIDGLPINDRFLREHSAEVSAIHFHWPEFIWQSQDERKWADRARTIVGLWRFLRLERRLGIPVIWTVHNLGRHEGSDWLDRVGVGIIRRSAALAIVHSEQTRESLTQEFDVDPRKIVSMPIGATPSLLPTPESRVETLETVGLTPARKTLLCFGLLRRYKGVDIALDALPMLGDTCQLIVAGKPHDAAFGRQIEAMARRAPNVRTILEAISDQHLSNLLNASDAVLLPYRRITGSAALLTALAAERGVVVADLPYFREVLRPEPDAAAFFRPGSASDLASAITTFLSVPLEIRNAAAGRLATRYDWPTVVEPVAVHIRRLTSDLVPRL